MPLVHDFVPLERDFEAIAGELLPFDAAQVAQRLDGSESAGAVFEFGRARFLDDTLVIPFRVSGGDAPFDALDADLRLEPVQREHTHLLLTGSYLSTSLSRRSARVRQRLVESWVRAYLLRVSSTLDVAGRQSVNR